MINYSLYQLVTLILMKHLEELDDFFGEDLKDYFKTEFISCRMNELMQQYDKIQRYQELNDRYNNLIAEIVAMDDKEQRDSMTRDLEELIIESMCEAAQFHYLAGLNDALRVFDV
jgi:hypothetical protein